MTTPKAPGRERRHQHALRDAVARAQARGFEITSRDPLTLRRGRATIQFQAGVLVEDLDPPPSRRPSPA